MAALTVAGEGLCFLPASMRKFARKGLCLLPIADAVPAGGNFYVLEQRRPFSIARQVCGESSQF